MLRKPSDVFLVKLRSRYQNLKGVIKSCFSIANPDVQNKVPEFNIAESFPGNPAFDNGARRTCSRL